MSHEMRDAHLFGPGPKRILTLDGGGIRGIVTIGMLERVEALLRQRLPKARQENFVLSDYFDLIAGTSTGSIIAAWLALGNSVSSVRHLYEELGPKVFGTPLPGGQFVWAKFHAGALERLLREHLGERTLASADLRTGLLITCKRVDTGSAWLLANNPKSSYWNLDRARRLRQVVRASTAAPSYFAPAEVPVGLGEVGLFVDGAMNGHNNPSLAAFVYATAAENGLEWKASAEWLLMLSLGTGHKRPKYAKEDFAHKPAGEQAIRTLEGMIYETSMISVVTMQSLSNPRHPFIINSAIHGLERTLIGGQALLQYERFDPPLERSKLRDELGLDFTLEEEIKFAKMDIGERANSQRLLTIGRAMGGKITDEIFPKAFDLQLEKETNAA